MLWAATGIAWALIFLGGADQLASNTFIDRKADGSAAPDALFEYVSSHHGVIGVLLVTLAIANVLFVVFGAYLASRARHSMRRSWLPLVAVVLAALATLPFWFADLGTASIWFATYGGARADGYRWISSTIDGLLPFGAPLLVIYIGLVAYLFRGSGALPNWVSWFSWAVAVIAVIFSGLSILNRASGAIPFFSVLLWTVIVSATAAWSAWRQGGAAYRKIPD